MGSDFEQFEKWAKKQEGKKKNWEAQLSGQEMMRKFKEKFRVDKHFPGTHCPVCTMRQLYKKVENEEADQYICKFCLSDIILTIVWRPEKTPLIEMLEAHRQKAKEEAEEEDPEDDDDDGEED